MTTYTRQLMVWFKKPGSGVSMEFNKQFAYPWPVDSLEDLCTYMEEHIVPGEQVFVTNWKRAED